MSKKGEKDCLLDFGDGNDNKTSAGYGLEGATDAGDYTDAVNGSTAEPAAKRMRPATKRDRLQRNPSLEKVDEDFGGERKAEKIGCPDYFGVKSYLHNFYDTHFYKDPDIYEDNEEFRYLLHHNKKRGCTSIWWKVFVWIGANFLVFGIIGVLVGYLVPQRPIIVGSIADNIEIIDKEAISFNFNLDVCKLVGLILFCIGGLTLTVALLFPSFLYQYCDDDRRDGSFKVRVHGEDTPLKSPLEMAVPATSRLTGVQPERKQDEAIVTQEGMVAIKD